MNVLRDGILIHNKSLDDFVARLEDLRWKYLDGDYVGEAANEDDVASSSHSTTSTNEGSSRNTSKSKGKQHV